MELSSRVSRRLYNEFHTPDATILEKISWVKTSLKKLFDEEIGREGIFSEEAFMAEAERYLRSYFHLDEFPEINDAEPPIEEECDVLSRNLFDLYQRFVTNRDKFLNDTESSEKGGTSFFVSGLVICCRSCGEERLLPVNGDVQQWFFDLSKALLNICPNCEEREQCNDWEEAFDSLLEQQELEDYEGIPFLAETIDMDFAGEDL